MHQGFPLSLYHIVWYLLQTRTPLPGTQYCWLLKAEHLYHASVQRTTLHISHQTLCAYTARGLLLSLCADSSSFTQPWLCTVSTSPAPSFQQRALQLALKLLKPQGSSENCHRHTLLQSYPCSSCPNHFFNFLASASESSSWKLKWQIQSMYLMLWHLSPLFLLFPSKVKQRRWKSIVSTPVVLKTLAQ